MVACPSHPGGSLPTSAAPWHLRISSKSQVQDPLWFKLAQERGEYELGGESHPSFQSYPDYQMARLHEEEYSSLMLGVPSKCFAQRCHALPCHCNITSWRALSTAQNSAECPSDAVFSCSTRRWLRAAALVAPIFRLHVEDGGVTGRPESMCPRANVLGPLVPKWIVSGEKLSRHWYIPVIIHYKNT